METFPLTSPASSHSPWLSCPFLVRLGEKPSAPVTADSCPPTIPPPRGCHPRCTPTVSSRPSLATGDSFTPPLRHFPSLPCSPSPWHHHELTRHRGPRRVYFLSPLEWESREPRDPCLVPITVPLAPGSLAHTSQVPDEYLNGSVGLMGGEPLLSPAWQREHVGGNQITRSGFRTPAGVSRAPGEHGFEVGLEMKSF